MALLPFSFTVVSVRYSNFIRTVHLAEDVLVGEGAPEVAQPKEGTPHLTLMSSVRSRMVWSIALRRAEWAFSPSYISGV